MRRRSTTTEENQRLSRGKLVRSGVGGGQLVGTNLFFAVSKEASLQNIQRINLLNQETTLAKIRGVNGGADDGSYNPISVSEGITNFIQISAYSSTTFSVTEDGTVWCCGFNLEGQLGDGTTTNRDYPVQVQNITDALEVYVGNGTACAAVNKRLDLKCWGSNHLGDGSSSSSSTPVTVTKTNGWGSNYTFDDVASGQASVCAYNLANNEVFCWGRNSEGQLGLGNTTDSLTMQDVGGPF